MFFRSKILKKIRNIYISFNKIETYILDIIDNSRNYKNLDIYKLLNTSVSSQKTKKIMDKNYTEIYKLQNQILGLHNEMKKEVNNFIEKTYPNEYNKL